MERLCKPELCTGCGACAAICPVGSIAMEADKEGFLRPVVQTETCIDCGRCRQVCPILAERSLSDDTTVAYAAIHGDEQVRLGSTSGGVFTLLSHWMLERGGVIFGAAYDDDFNVVHCRVDKACDLHKLRGAKYAQSSLGNTFRQAQTCLQEGQYVLFSGTPCQIGGLVSFLRKDYERLVLVDLICHGVPSPKVWRHYIGYRSSRDACGQKPAAINLRSKETGWPGYSIRFEYPQGQVYSAPNAQDPYLRGFVRDLYLRPSCYHCRFKGRTRQSDFTLGDYWGVWSQMPAYHDGKGTSLVLAHTKKARMLMDELSAAMKCCQVDLSNALEENPSAVISSPYTEKRDEFFRCCEDTDFSSLVDALCPKPVVKKASLVRRLVRKIRRILRP